MYESNYQDLPQKLTNEEFLYYYQEFKQGNREARQKLIEHNLRLSRKKFIDLMRKYSIDNFYKDELESASMLGLIKSVDTFDLEKGVQFSTYASRVINNEMLMVLRRDKRYFQTISLEQSLTNDEEENEFTELDILADLNSDFESKIVDKRYFSKIREALKKILDEKEYTVIFHLYGFNGNKLTKNQIASMLGFSQSYISRIEKRALKKLRVRLDKNISEVEDYQNRFRQFDVHSIHVDLTPGVFRKLLSFFPKSEIALYTQRNGIILQENGIRFKNISGGGVSNDTERKQLELIEHDLREMFVYYTQLKANKYERRVFEKVEKYCLKHFLRFRYKEYTLDEIRQATKNLRKRFQKVLYLRHGEDFLSYHEFLDDVKNNTSLLSLAHQKLKEELERKPTAIHPKSLRAIYSHLSFQELDEYVKKLPLPFQEVIYLRHSKSLDKYNKFPENKSYSAYYAVYQKAIKALEQVMAGQIVVTENKRSVIDEYAREDLLYALPKIPEIIQFSVYLRHGKNLDTTISWMKIKILDDQPLSFYRSNYYRSYGFIDRVLETRRELQEKSKKTSIIKLGKYDLLEIQEAMKYLSADERNVIYLKHSKTLTEFHPWPNNRPFSYYRDLYDRSIFHLKKILKDKNKRLEEEQSIVSLNKVSIEKKPLVISENVSEKPKKKENIEVRKNSKNILNEVTRENLLWVCSKLNKHQLEILHIRHGENLDRVLAWPEVPKDKEKNYYFYSYYNVCKRIHTLLEKRAKVELAPSTNVLSAQPKESIEMTDMLPKKAKKKKKVESLEKQQISKKRAVLMEQQKVLTNQKETHLKIEFYNKFYALYGEVLSSEKLETIICDVVSSYTQDVGISIEYFCQFKIESSILISLANIYKDNPESEESLKILMLIHSIFVGKMKVKYPFLEDSRIEMAIEEVLNTYEVEKNFSVEVMKNLRKHMKQF